MNYNITKRNPKVRRLEILGWVQLSSAPPLPLTSTQLNATVSMSTPFPTILPSGVIPRAYRVRLAPNVVTSTYTFAVDLQIDLPPHTNSITLHWLPKQDQPPLAAVTFGTVSATPDQFSTSGAQGVVFLNDQQTSTSVTLDPATQTITFQFSKDLPTTQGHLLLSGSSILDDSLCGLYRSAYVCPHSGEKKYMCVTQFEATDARRCFPCVDEPSAKATFEMIVETDRSLDVVSNMAVKERRSLNATSVIVSFPPSPIMSTYLVALIVGEFDYISTLSSNGVMTSIYTPRGQGHLGQHALSVASQALPFFEAQFGVKYPLPKSDLLAIPDFAGKNVLKSDKAQCFIWVF